ncbi:MAG: hypothetical protein V4749_07770 [Pseudomonadota bacterium]
MSSLDAKLNHKTPQLFVVDGRGLGVRSISYHRHPGSPAVIDERITRQRFNLQGQLIQSIDPRLFELQREDSTIEPNLSYWHSLVGTPLRTDSVDAGISVTLNDRAGRPHLSVSATGVTRTWVYEDQTLAGRLLKVTDQAANAQARITERFVWAGNSSAEQALNLSGQCVEYYDTAGLSRTHSIDLTGVPQSVSRQLLEEGLEANWQGAEPGDWQTGLASEVFTTLCSADAGGTPDSNRCQRQCAAPRL